VSNFPKVEGNILAAAVQKGFGSNQLSNKQSFERKIYLIDFNVRSNGVDSLAEFAC
jgi:hypothetical protein